MTIQMAIGCERGNPLSPSHGTYHVLKNSCCFCFVMLVCLFLWFILCVFCVCVLFCFCFLDGSTLSLILHLIYIIIGGS